MAEPGGALASQHRSKRDPDRALARPSIVRLGALCAGLIIATLTGPHTMQFTRAVAQSNSGETTLDLPDEQVLARLLWTSMVALDNANRTDNYGVLHALGSDDFKRRHSPESLRATFAALRSRRIDIGRALLIDPTYFLNPGFDSEGHLRLRGAFEFRSDQIWFDILFQPTSAGWRIHALSILQVKPEPA